MEEVKAANDSMKMLSAIACLAVDEDDLPIADSMQQAILSEQRSRLLKAKPDMIDAEMRLLHDEAKRPRDAVMEVNCPASTFKDHYLAVDSGLARAEWLLSQPGFGKPDRGYVQVWRDRLAWILGGHEASTAAPAGAISTKGRLLINGQPACMVRVVFMRSQPGLISGGGYQSFVSGLDTVLGPDIPPLPDNEFYTAMTDALGNFQMKMKPGGPYSFVALPVQRAASRLETAAVVVRDTTQYQTNVGWTLPSLPIEQDLGAIAINLNFSDKTSRPLLDIRSFYKTPTVFRGDRIEFPIRLANRGTLPLKVTRIKTDCGCSAVYSQSGVDTPVTLPVTLEPSQSIVWYMAVKTDTTTPLGATSKAILFTTNDPLAPNSRMEVHFVTDEVVRLEPSLLRFHVEDKAVTQTVRLITEVSPPPKIKNVSRDSTSPVSVEVAADGQSAIVTVDPAKLPKDQPSYSQELTLPLEGKSISPLTLPVYCRRSDSLLAEPPSFNFGLVRRGTKVKRMVKLMSPENAGNVKSLQAVEEQLNVVTFQPRDNGLEIEMEIMGKGPDILRITLGGHSETHVDLPVKWRLADE